jgi:hypothetical protein
VKPAVLILLVRAGHALRVCGRKDEGLRYCFCNLRSDERLARIGLHLWTTVNIFPETECFTLGEEVVAFLGYDSDSHVHYFAAGGFAADRIRDGMVTPMTSEGVSRRGDLTVEASVFFNDLLRLR